MKTFSDKTNNCAEAFRSAGPLWHAWTPGKETPILFTSDDDFRLVMNQIALSASEYPEIPFVSFEVMNNHFHFSSGSDEEKINAFWCSLRRRLCRFFPLVKDIKLRIKEITSLDAMKHTIAYIHRNGYVANPNYMPHNYPWGTGPYYFEKISCGTPLQDISLRSRREVLKCRDPQLPLEWKLTDGYVCPASYCDLELGMSMFRNAHDYYYTVSKKVESYSGVATEIDDGEFLTDPELFAQVIKIVNEQYKQNSLKGLTGAQRLDLAKILHFRFRSSNGQIRRILGLTQYEVDQLFPRIQR